MTKFRNALSGSTGGIVFVIIAAVGISINDMLIKHLSDGYPLHQLTFIRSAIGLIFSFTILHYEGGVSQLWPKRPVLHLIRAMMIVAANMLYFMALAVMPLADATALFFVAPIFITLLSIPFLGETVGPRRLIAVGVGLVGVVVMLRPGGQDGNVPLLVMVLPVIAALAYAMMQILTRKLRFSTTASAMAIYIQLTFILVGAGFYLVAGDGRYAHGLTNESLIFILRPWVWPMAEDMKFLVGLGFLSALIGYTLSQAYRLSDAATIAPYEYSSMPLAVLWGWFIFGSIPGMSTIVGIVLIIGAGIYVFLRERARREVTL